MTLEQLIDFLQKYKDCSEYKIKIITDCECNNYAYNILVDNEDKKIYIYMTTI